MLAVAEPITTTQARERGLLAGRTARCTCGRECPSEGPMPGFKDIAFLEYLGPGSKHAVASCSCGYAEVAHTAEVRARNSYICEAFAARGPHEFDSYYCGCRGWD